jgi:hypothetical protein
LIRVAQFIGDFGNPFYDEERQRDVWNEACAFGLQLLLWSTLGVLAVAVWVVGEPAVPYAEGALVVVGAVCLLTIGYAHRLGVRLTDPARLLRLRLLPYVVLLAALLLGMARASDASRGFVVGAGTGALVALLALAWTGRRSAA